MDNKTSRQQASWFPLVAVFSTIFMEKLNVFEQQLHLIDLLLVVLATMLILNPGNVSHCGQHEH